MLQFKDIAPQESSLKSIGTVAQFAGVGGYHELTSDKNFKGTLKDNGKLTNITVAIYNAQGQRAYVNCSEAVSKDLRASKSEEELNEKLANLVSLPILELPQFNEDGSPVMIVDEETGEEKQLVIYTISNTGAKDMSATRVNITENMLKREIAKRAINLEDLIAV
jgi:hypothetical protein